MPHTPYFWMLLVGATLLAVPVYEPAPWYVRWLETMPLYVVVTLAVLAFVVWLLKAPIEAAAIKLLDRFTERIKRSSKEPISAAEFSRKATKAVILEQAAERLRLQIDCDHVSVYGCQNGEHLRSGEGVDKFVMQAEATARVAGRYMDVERVVMAQDIPRLVLSLGQQTYVLIWSGRHDDWKVNKMMSERGYTSTVALFIRKPIKPGSPEMGVIGMFAVSWHECEIYRPDQADKLPQKHIGPTRLLDHEMEQMLLQYAQQFSYNM